MRFINLGEPLKIRKGEMRTGYHWVTLKKGESIDLPEREGKAYGLVVMEALESKIQEKTVETKQFNNSNNVNKVGQDGERDG